MASNQLGGTNVNTGDPLYQFRKQREAQGLKTDSTDANVLESDVYKQWLAGGMKDSGAGDSSGGTTPMAGLAAAAPAPTSAPAAGGAAGAGSNVDLSGLNSVNPTAGMLGPSPLSFRGQLATRNAPPLSSAIAGLSKAY